MSRTVISYQDLGGDFRELAGRGAVEPIRFTTVTGLRGRGMLQMLRQIRGLKAQQLVVAIEDESMRQLGTPLILLAALTGSREIAMLWPDRKMESISRVRVLDYLFRICLAQVTSRLAYWRAWWRVRGLEKTSTAKHRRPGSLEKKVLYLDGNLPIGSTVGGSVGHTRGVIDGLIGSGFEVDYASGKTIPTGRAGARGLMVPPIDFLALPPELNCYGFNVIFDRSAEAFARKKPYAFIYQRMSVHNFTGAILRRRLAIPLVLEYNGSEAWTASNWNRRLQRHDMAVRTEQASLLNADLVVTVSDALADEVASAGVPREKILTYPNCIDPEIFDPDRFSSEQNLQLRERLKIPADARIATFIGTFGAWHGVDFLARALRRLIDEDRAWVTDSKLHFLLIGDGLKMAEVRAQLGGPPYSDFVTLTGTVPQASAPAYLAASDIFLCPHVPNADGSVFFGSPTKLFEYMAMQRPIIASDLAQIGRVLRAGYFDAAGPPGRPLAELFVPGDETDFLAALRRVIRDPAAAAATAREARAAALNAFTWRHHATAILSRAESLGILR